MISKVMAFILLVIAGLGDDITAIRVGLVFSGFFILVDIIDYKHKKTFIRTDKGKNKNKICNLILTHPSTWLNQERWKDEVSEVKKKILSDEYDIGI